MKIQTYQTNKIQKTIIATYLDHQDVVWSFEAIVTLTKCNEVNHVELLWAENDESAEFTEHTFDGIAEFAGDRAMEKFEIEDFVIEEDDL